eukprot:GFKZ01014962.1.p1 GENE.GFKZ01014962.1~~GFKZ01014962.1.p1  ORF type:complete len:338 (+),score=41.39 GFKZ01014962.1:183-1196(+)
MTHPTVTQTITRIRASLKTHNLLPPHQNLLLAISGGQDSLTLCESLRYIRQTTHPTPWPQFALAHCDHRWPGDDGIAAHVQRYADSVRLPLLLFDAMDNPPPCSESAGREWRYAALARMAKQKKFNAVVTGHTRTDLAETVLFNLCHGAGSHGLSAMGWTRTLCGGVALVRPMLDVSREQTGEFCEQSGLEVWHDVYNEDRRYARNRIRGDVMPVLKEALHERVEEALVRTASLLREDARHLEEEAGAVFERAVVVEANGRLLMDRDVMGAASVAVRRRVVKRVLEEFLNLDARRKVFKQVEAVVRLCEGRVGEAAPSLAKGGGARVVCERWIEINK